MQKKNNLLDAALDYAKNGYSVFPCIPRGKRPLVSNGFHDATTDKEKILEWWTKWPDANIGIPTGSENGIIVIDIDSKHGGEESIKGCDLPETVESSTGGGGRHIIYSHPGHPIKSTTMVGGMSGVDSRADGGYIIAPPSIHETDNAYMWETSFHDMKPAAPPSWWLEILASDRKNGTIKPSSPWIKQSTNEKIEEGGRNVYLTSMAGKYRSQGHGETAIFYMIKGIYEEQCDHDPPIDDDELWSIAKSVSRYQTFEEEFAREIEIGDKAAESIWISHQEKIAEEMGTDKTVKAETPTSLIPSVGLIKDMVDFILSQSRFPRPSLAMAASVTFIGALMGQKYRTLTGLRSNVYMVGLAKSGMGKDAARKVIKRLAHKAGAMDYLGEERIASGQGLVSSLAQFPKKWYPLDEFGRMLQGITGKSSEGYKKEIMTNLMQFYSSAGSVFQGTAYADKKKAPDSKIVDPCCIVYGTSTHDSFFASLTSSETVGGELARFLIVDAGKDRGKSVRFSEIDPPEDLIDRLRKIVEFKGSGGNLSDIAIDGVQTHEPIIVPMTPEVADLWDDLDNSMTELMENDASSSIYSRVAENTAKLAMIYAVSLNYIDPVIDEYAFNWARELALWSANLMMEHINTHVADNAQEAMMKRVTRLIKDRGDNGISRRDLTRSTQFLKRYEREDIIESLIDGRIIFRKWSKDSNRPKEIFTHISFFDPDTDLIE